MRKIKIIIKALMSLGWDEDLTEFSVKIVGETAEVKMNGEYFGVYDFCRNTFTD